MGLGSLLKQLSAESLVDKIKLFRCFAVAKNTSEQVENPRRIARVSNASRKVERECSQKHAACVTESDCVSSSKNTSSTVARCSTAGNKNKAVLPTLPLRQSMDEIRARSSGTPSNSARTCSYPIDEREDANNSSHNVVHLVMKI